MPTPPPVPDPSHIELRLVVLAEMLETAVAEVRRITAEIKGAQDAVPPPSQPGSADD